MRSKFVTCAAAAAMLALPVLSGPASAQSWRHHHGGHHHGWGHRGGFGAGVAGFAAGAIIGGALASRPYYGGDAYGPAYYDYGPEYYAAPAPGGDAVAYCMQRFRSYDPASGTYLGYDGLRHPCP